MNTLKALTQTSNKRMPTTLRVLSGFILLIITLSLIALFFPSLIRRTSAVESMGVGVYWNSECTQEVTSIYWGQLSPGSKTSVQLFAKNEKADKPIYLGMRTQNWTPAQATNYITLSWNYDEKSINPQGKKQIILTLKIAGDISKITDFSFDIVFIGSEHMFGDLDKDGYIGIADIVAMTALFGTTPSHPNWNFLADLNFNNIVGIDDLVKLVEKYSTFST